MKSLIQFLLRNVPRKHLQKVSHVGLCIVQVFYLGNRVECPICTRRYRKFLPYGRQQTRPNALCPNCLGLERHRLIWLYLKQKTTLFDGGGAMLHIAPELCFIDRFEEIEGLEYVTGDIESPLAKVKMDIHEMPFDDASFDCCMCNHVMEHVENDIQAMKEICRVLKPGGWAIIQIPLFYPLQDVTQEDPSITDPVERERLFGQDDHVRLYGKDYAKRLASAGFEVLEDQFLQELDQEAITRYALPDEPVFFVRRPL